jgi:hypothetical protein
MSGDAYEGSRYPEGLHLTITPDQDTLGIFDAGDLMWVEFCPGGLGDPVRWPKNVVIDTCAALRVTVAINEVGEEVSISTLLDGFYGDVDFLD